MRGAIVAEDRLSLLIVDDESALCTALRRMLSPTYDVTTAASVEEALELLASGGRYQIALVDDRLPLKQGVELLTAFRDNWPSSVRLLMSAYTDFPRLVGAINQGQIHGFLSKPFTKDELDTALVQATQIHAIMAERDNLTAALAEQNQALEGLVQKRTRQLEERNLQLEELATRDPLTGLYNRRFLEARISEELARLQRYETPFSIAVLDVDDFKRVNDSFGHPVGDSVLKEVASFLQDNIRKVDSVGRFGGEEFVLLLPNTPLDGATLVAERIREDLAKKESHVRAAEPVSVTVSGGVAEASAGDHGWEEFFGRADKALYQAKAEGKNRVRAGRAS